MEVILYVFGVWAACSLVMMFFLPLVEKTFESSSDDLYHLVAFAPFAVPVLIGVAIFWGVYKLGQKVFA